jgi:hypothetical protein
VLAEDMRGPLQPRALHLLRRRHPGITVNALASRERELANKKKRLAEKELQELATTCMKVEDNGTQGTQGFIWVDLGVNF